eukprot:m.175615 g.175615  ORF g.175615 m.175615 type:complete len:84 (-) comp31828_c0_seq4:1426-1677(-)
MCGPTIIVTNHAIITTNVVAIIGVDNGATTVANSIIAIVINTVVTNVAIVITTVAIIFTAAVTIIVNTAAKLSPVLSTLSLSM